MFHSVEAFICWSENQGDTVSKILGEGETISKKENPDRNISLREAHFLKRSINTGFEILELISSPGHVEH